ncbi:MAG: amidohydrolase family protein, partial [Planctomycetota bacterium]
MKVAARHLAVLFLSAAGLAAMAASARPAPEEGAGRGYVAVRAGTVHLVDGGAVLEGGGTILVRQGVIEAAGRDVEVPLDAQVVDYGPDAVIVPGLVAAESTVSFVRPTGRTAQPELRAIDGFDFYAEHVHLLSAGVTTIYVPAARDRLLGGQGAVVKVTGDDPARRTLAASAALQGAIDRSARNAPGFWDPPVPAAPDNDLGYARRELPRTAMGAIVALDELFAAARAGAGDTEYGPHAAPALAAILAAGAPWRIAAETEPEIRALLGFAAEKRLRLVVDGAAEANLVAEEIAAAGAGVIWRLPFAPGGPARDRGKKVDDRWPDLSVPAALVAAGVPVAIADPAGRNLLFAAGAASQGGLSPAAALRAITLTPAELLGVANRVGSLRSGKDADFVVLSGAPLSGQATVRATWSDGKKVWESHASTAVVLDVRELHVGDGEVLRPGQLLMRDGRIVEVGERVAHPPGAVVVHGEAAMPGMIDGLGFLGLEGSGRTVGTEYSLRQIVAPGDAVDRRVAAAGVTTVALTPRGIAGSGSPVLAYKPAARDLDAQVLGDPVAVRLQWTEQNRLNSGKAVRDLLAKAREYRDKWIEYEKALAAWTPPPPAPAAEEGPAGEEEKPEAEGGEKKEEEAKEAAGEPA